MRVLLLLVLFAAPAFAQHPDHTAVVAAVKADLLQRGFDISSPNDSKPCNVFAITRRVAWKLKGEGIGYVKKGGNNCEGFSVDALMYQDGTVIDTLVGSGEANTPAWNHVGTRPVTDWAAPTDPGDTPPPPPPTTDLTAILARLTALEARATSLSARVDALQAEVGGVETTANSLAGRVQVLESKPTPTSCSAAANLGAFKIPISCRLQ